jgi:MFS family permease
MPSTPPGIGQPTREARTGREDRGQRGNKRWTLVAVCLGTFMLLLDITIANVALPDIQRVLHSSFADLQWVVDAYALTLASFLLTAGSLADIYGRRVLYLIGLVVFTGASALCGFATSALMLQLSRGLQGAGGAIMFAVSLALLANAFRGKDRGVAFGVWGAVTGLAVAIGPLIGGVLTSGLSWRWIFFVNVPIGIAAVALTTTRVAESRSPRATGPDWAGFVIFTAALASLVYGLIESNQRSFTDRLVLGCLAAAAVLLAVFLIVERRSAYPMFDLELLRLPTFSGGSVAAFGHRTLTITRKGGKIIPLAPCTGRAIDLAIGEHTGGPVFLATDGRRLDRHGAGRIVRKTARRAGIAKTVTPHTLRHAFITAALDARVPLRDVQEAASHAAPRTTMRCDRACGSLDRHATYIVAAYLASAAR